MSARNWCAGLMLALISIPCGASADTVAHGTHGAVASVAPLATEAGLAVLKNGGNAIDAAIAVGATLGVVDGPNSGLGGGCFMLIHRANGEIIAIDGREMAPAAATHDMFVRDGKGNTDLSQTGALASGIPGSVAAYAYAVEKFGRKKFGELLLPAAKIAEDGFPIDHHYAAKIESVADDLRTFEASKALLFHEDGTPLAEGDTLKQPDLAASLRALAAQGPDWFYRGPYATKVAEWMKANGGIITAEDFANYHIALREPVRGTYRGAEIVSFPPPSSGGVHVIEILNMLENFDLAKLNEPTRVHVIAEAMKLAFADRAHWLGDPDFVPVPRGLLDKGYAKDLAERIQLDAVIAATDHGEPPNATTDVFGKKHTTHFSVADAEGNWVACTQTINTTFGSKVIVPGTGILLNNQMDDFSIQPGVPNAFGLVGAEANAVGPGKRPLSSMSPTLVLRDGHPILAVGAAGGPRIITQTVLNLVGVLDLGLSLDAALAQPRFHHQWQPDELRIESRAPDAVREFLTKLGHPLDSVKNIGASNGVAWSDGTFTAASEPRLPSEAAAW
ncbi:gamma-glutamyltransferase [Chthoniobacter flavus Ellin428]|uniref:Glutathione hydrolase proenzyme n=1 Tax=Chthoniobacter flavus Ellin428 TaxID=497964 RepID=B4D9T0_9BACT|nr:gamma-glutamyltransferase [Chthoniobacter flavus]EDY16861.1 gamma-glutamyltransferase [Chthoniobacter flavus Ellin428]TCO93316.1 gamma-glutamyltransferase 1 [Chthoniobacter flavus]